MTPADRNFDLVINKRDLDYVMCSSNHIDSRMNMYRDEVERVLRLGDLKDENGDSENNEGGEGKGGTTTTLSMVKNATRKDKKKSVTTTAANKEEEEEPPSSVGW